MTSCTPHVEAQTVEGPPEPDSNGNPWCTFALTGRARATCTCGHDTGTIANAQALAALDTHQEAR